MTGGDLRIGLAGLGQHGLRYAAHLLNGDVDGARLTAVHRRDRAAGRDWASDRGVAFEPDLESLAARNDVDALIAALPPTLHPRAVQAAASQRKAILVEKPLAPSAPQARRAVDAAAAAAIPAMVAQTMRFDSTVRGLVAALPRIGAIHMVTVSHRFEPTGRAWLDDPAEGGLVSNTGIHGIDLLRHITGGEIAEIAGIGGRVVLEHADDVFAGILRLEPGGIVATIDNSRATGSRSGRIEVIGERGQLLADHVTSSLVLAVERSRQLIELPPPVPTVREALRAFAAAVTSGNPVPIPLEEGLAAVEAVDRLRSAIEAGP